MTTNDLDLTSYDEVTFEFIFVSNGFDNGEDFWLQYSTGGGYNTVAQYVAGTTFNNGTYYQSTIVIPGPFTGNTSFRLRCDASANNDQVYIDNVVITGCKNGSSACLADPDVTERLESEKVLSNINLYPNPTSDVLNIDLELTQEANVEFMVIDMTGKSVFVRSLSSNEGSNKMSFDMNDLPAGIYMMNVISGKEMITKRFIIQR